MKSGMTQIFDIFKYIDILFFSFSENTKTFNMTLHDWGYPLLQHRGIKLNGLGLYLNPGTEVWVCVTNRDNGKTVFDEKVSVPVTSFTRVTNLIFDHPVGFSQRYGYGHEVVEISLSVKVTGKGSAKTTKDEEKTERFVRVKLAMSETKPVRIIKCENSIIGERELYFTSPSN